MSQTKTARGVLRRGLQLLAGGALLALAMFVPAGTLGWWQAWAVLAIFLGAIAFNAVVILRGDPELIAERGETREDTKGWDRVVTATITLSPLLIPVVGVLDLRFGCSSAPLPVSVAGLILTFAGYLSL